MKTRILLMMVITAFFLEFTLIESSQCQDVQKSVKKIAKPADQKKLSPESNRSDINAYKEWLDSQTDVISINNQDFSNIITTIFMNANFTANSCGNVNEYPHQIKFSQTDIPVMIESLDRMEYTLTDAERQETVGSYYSGIPLIAETSGTCRTTKIRACVEHWNAREWVGSIEGGYLQVVLRLKTNQLTSNMPGEQLETMPLIKTRRMAEYKPSKLPSFVPSVMLLDWRPLWEWNNPYSDATIKDYINGNGMFIIRLIPAVSDNKISYVVGDVEWYSSGSTFMHTFALGQDYPGIDLGLFTQVPALKDKILNYNEDSVERIREFVISIFNNSTVTSLLGDALTNLCTQKVGSNVPIKDIYVSGNEVKVVYAPQGQ